VSHTHAGRTDHRNEPAPGREGDKTARAHKIALARKRIESGYYLTERVARLTAEKMIIERGKLDVL
jgi:hypothetical protein